MLNSDFPARISNCAASAWRCAGAGPRENISGVCESFPGVRHLKSGSLDATAAFPHTKPPELGELILQYLTKDLPYSGLVRIGLHISSVFRTLLLLS
jgi:hypothetical protein